MNKIFSKAILFAMLVFTIVLTGCVTQPAYQAAPPYGYRGGCPACGVVQNVQQIYVQGQNNSGLGTIIGAVAGGVLGSTIGKGGGRTAATVVGAVAGGAVGNQVGQQSSGTTTAFQIVIRLDNGQYATVTQGANPGVRPGDYVQIVNNQVYAR